MDFFLYNNIFNVLIYISKENLNQSNQQNKKIKKNYTM
jgi:hypothetical protein